MFNPTTKQKQKLKNWKEAQRQDAWIAMVNNSQSIPSRVTSRRVFERDGVDAWDATGGASFNATKADLTPRKEKATKQKRQQKQVQSVHCTCNGLSGSPRRKSPMSPSMKQSSSRSFERFGKGSVSRSPHKGRLKQCGSVQKELMEKPVAYQQSTQSQNLKHLQTNAERVSSTISEIEDQNAGSSIESSQAFIGINAHVRINPDMDMLRRDESLPPDQYTKQQIQQLRLYQRSEDTFQNYQHIEEQKDSSSFRKSAKKQQRDLQIKPDSSLRFTKTGADFGGVTTSSLDQIESSLGLNDTHTSSDILQKSAMRGVNLRKVEEAQSQATIQGSKASFNAPDYQIAKHTSQERLQYQKQQQQAKRSSKRNSQGSISRSPKKSTRKLNTNAPMFEKNANHYVQQHEKRREQKRNAQLFKSIELPQNRQGSIWAPAVGPKTSKNYDRMIMGWAAGEATERSSMTVDRMDEKVEQIVQKYCNKDDSRNNNNSTLNPGTRYRTNKTTIDVSQERSRYMQRDLLEIAVKRNDEIFEAKHFLGSKPQDRTDQYSEFKVRKRLLNKEFSEKIPLTFTVNEQDFDSEMRQGLHPHNCPIRPAESPPRFRFKSKTDKKDQEVQQEVEKLSCTTIQANDISHARINVQSSMLSLTPATSSMLQHVKTVPTNQEDNAFNPLANMDDDQVLNMDPGHLIKYHALMDEDVKKYEETVKSSKTFTAEDIVHALKLTFQTKTEFEPCADDIELSDAEGGEEKKLKKKDEWSQDKKRTVDSKLQEVLKTLERNLDIKTVSDYDTTAQSVRINGMAHFDQTMKKIARHCRKMLDVGVHDVYKHIERTLFEHDAEPSPLLKFYNDVMTHTKFEIPPRVKLNTDQEVFKKLLRKYRRAQELECKWIRDQAVEEGKLYIQRQFEATRTALQDECLILLKKHDDIMKQLAEAESKNHRYCEKLVQQEEVMANMWTYFLHTRGEIISEDFDIYDMDQRELPSRRACKRASLKIISPTEYSNAGVVEVDNLIYEKEFAVKGFMMPDNVDLRSPTKSLDCSPRSPQKTQNSQYDMPTSSSPSKPGLSLMSKMQSGVSIASLGQDAGIGSKLQTAIQKKLADQVQRAKDEEESAGKPFVTEAERQQRLLCETHTELKGKAFSLYGTYTELKMHEKIKAVENEIIRHQTIKFKKLEDQKKSRENEYSLLYDICKDSMKNLDDQTAEVKKLRTENAEATKKYDQMLRQKNHQFDSTVKSMNENFEKQFERCKNMYGIENKVLEHIVNRQMIDVVQNRFKTDRLRALLRIPRTSIHNIQNYGIFDFIKQCRAAIGEEEKDIPDRPRSPLPHNFAVATTRRLRACSQVHAQSTMNLKGTYDAEFKEARPWHAPEKRIKRPPVMKGQPAQYISAGQFKVDLLQRESHIKRALTQSWAEECGVVLQDNPSLKQNKPKYVLGKNGAKLSAIPESMFQNIMHQIEEQQITTADVDNIEKLDKIRQQCQEKMIESEVGDTSPHMIVSPSTIDVSHEISTELKITSKINLQASTTMTMASDGEGQLRLNTTEMRQQTTVTEEKQYAEDGNVALAAHKLNQSSSIDRGSVVNSSAYDILHDRSQLENLNMSIQDENKPSEYPQSESKPDRHLNNTSKQSHITDNSNHIHVASFEFQRNSPMSKEKVVDNYGQKSKIEVQNEDLQ